MANVVLSSVQVREASPVAVGTTVHVDAYAYNLGAIGTVSGLCKIVPDRAIGGTGIVWSTQALVLGTSQAPLEMYWTMENVTNTFRVKLQEKDASGVWQDRFTFPTEFTITPIPPYVGTPQAHIWAHSIIPTVPIPAGTAIDILVTVENVGGSTGTMQAWVAEDNVNFEGIPPAFWKDIAPGGREQFALRFTMPDYNVQFKLVAQRWDWDISQWINDDVSELFTITKAAAEGNATASIVNIDFAQPAESHSGAIVTIPVQIKNVGDATGNCRAWALSSQVTFSSDKSWTSLAPGATAVFNLKFVMQNQDVSFTVQALHESSLGLPVVDQVSSEYKVQYLSIVAPAISIVPTSGKIGASVTVGGVRFHDSSPVNVIIGDAVLGSCTSTGGVLPGIFSLNAVIPTLAEGSKIVTATDALGSTASCTFTVTVADGGDTTGKWWDDLVKWLGEGNNKWYVIGGGVGVLGVLLLAGRK